MTRTRGEPAGDEIIPGGSEKPARSLAALVAVWVVGTVLLAGTSGADLPMGWSPPERIAVGVWLVWPRVALDSSGNGIAVWVQFRGPTSADGADIWASQYTAGTGWQNAIVIAPGNGTDWGPQLAVNEGGQAVVFWAQGPSVLAVRFSPSAGWSHVETVAARMNLTAAPAVTIDPSGRATAAWVENGHIWSSRFVAGLGWSVPERVDTGSEMTGAPSLVAEGASSVLAVWSQPTGLWYDVQASRWIEGVGWGVPELLDASDTEAAVYPVIGASAAGRILVVWRQGIDPYSLGESHYSSDSGWTAPEQIETLSGSAWLSQLAVDRAGDALVAWVHTSNLSYRFDSVWATRFSMASGAWTEAIRIDPPGADPPITGDLSIGVDGSGRGLAAWTTRDLPYVARFEGVWSPGAAFNQQTFAGGFQLAVAGDGAALLLWTSPSGVYASSFLPTTQNPEPSITPLIPVAAVGMLVGGIAVTYVLRRRRRTSSK